MQRRRQKRAFGGLTILTLSFFLLYPQYTRAEKAYDRSINFSTDKHDTYSLEHSSRPAARAYTPQKYPVYRKRPLVTAALPQRSQLRTVSSPDSRTPSRNYAAKTLNVSPPARTAVNSGLLGRQKADQQAIGALQHKKEFCVQKVKWGPLDAETGRLKTVIGQMRFDNQRKKYRYQGSYSALKAIYGDQIGFVATFGIYKKPYVSPNVWVLGSRVGQGEWGETYTMQAAHKMYAKMQAFIKKELPHQFYYLQHNLASSREPKNMVILATHGLGPILHAEKLRSHNVYVEEYIWSGKLTDALFRWKPYDDFTVKVKRAWRLAKSRDAELVIAVHSWGGRFARYALKKLAKTNPEIKVDKLILMGAWCTNARNLPNVKKSINYWSRHDPLSYFSWGDHDLDLKVRHHDYLDSLRELERL